MSRTYTTTTVKPHILHPSHIAAIAPETFSDASTGGNVTWKTLMSNDKTATDTFTTGIATCPPGATASCPESCPASASSSSCLGPAGQLKLHRHSHAEMYHITAGCGIVSIDGKDHHVQRGSVVYIPGNAEHGIRNSGIEEELVWLYVFAANGFGEVVYRFSGADKDIKAKL